MKDNIPNDLKNMSGMGFKSKLDFLKNALEHTDKKNIIVIDMQGEFDSCNRYNQEP